MGDLVKFGPRPPRRVDPAKCFVTGEPILIPENAHNVVLNPPGIPSWLGGIPVVLSTEGSQILERFAASGGDVSLLPEKSAARQILGEAQGTSYALRMLSALQWLAAERGSIYFTDNGVAVGFSPEEIYTGDDPLNTIATAKHAREGKETL